MTQTEWIISLDDDLKDSDELFVGNIRDGERLIRCKDCGHWDYCDSGVDGTAQGECFVFSMMTNDMCFCCWAEGKDHIVIIHPEDFVFNSEEDEKAYYEALGTERKEELDCNDCYYSMQNCNDRSVCCEDETALCDNFEPVAERKEE